MEIEITHRPYNAAAKLGLGANEVCVTEAGSMIAMSDGLAIETSTHQKGSGGIVSGLKRMLAGESFFLNHYTAGASGAHVWVAPTLPGDIMEYQLQNETLVVQSGSFLACEQSVQMEMGWQGFKSLFSGESLFWLKLSGSGKAALSSYGAIFPLEVDGEHVVDTGHIVAFNETLQFSIGKAGASLIGSFLGGEGFVCRFRGKGTIWCQSHQPKAFGQALGPKLRPR